MKHLLVFLFGICFSTMIIAADRLAVAEPAGKGGVSAADIEAFWGILESSIRSDEYKLISRGALRQMLTEIGLTTSSGLVNLNSTQRAKLGRIEAVRYILISEIGKFGSRYNCTMRILDSSTGEIDQARTANLRVRDFDELADKIEATLQQMLSDNKKSNASAILYPVIRIANAPHYLESDFIARMEHSLLNSGVPLQNLRSVSRILKRNNLSRLSSLEPKMYVKVGKLLEVKTLIHTFITRFEIIGRKYYVEETGARGIRWNGAIEGYVRIISAQNGRILGNIPFEEKVDFRDLSYSTTRDWTADDYGKHLIKTVVPRKIIPGLIKIPALTGK